MLHRPCKLMPLTVDGGKGKGKTCLSVCLHSNRSMACEMDGLSHALARSAAVHPATQINMSDFASFRRGANINADTIIMSIICSLSNLVSGIKFLDTYHPHEEFVLPFTFHFSLRELQQQRQGCVCTKEQPCASRIWVSALWSRRKWTTAMCPL
jgi:hypothetical protein